VHKEIEYLKNAVLPPIRLVNACLMRLTKAILHSETDHSLTPRPRAMIPPVLQGSVKQKYFRLTRGIAYLVPTIKSKKCWTYKGGPSSDCIASRTRSSKMPLIPLLSIWSAPILWFLQVNRLTHQGTELKSKRMVD
jgi:hypothetical protein